MFDDMMYGLPEMKSGGQHGGLDRWFAEKWVDIKTGKECGRQEGEKRKGYPACRPSKRVSSDTPKTSSELSPAERAKFKREKTSSKRIDYQHRRREFGGEEMYDIMNEFKSGGNVPTNPALWSKAKAAAKAKYDVYPSAYANGFAAKWYKEHGGGWKKAEYGMEIMGDGGMPDNPGFNALPEYVQHKIMSNMKHGGAVDLNAFYNQPRYIQTNIYEAGGPAPKPPTSRSFLPIVPQIIPGVNDAIDFSDIMLGAWYGDKTRMNQGVIGLGSPGIAGKAVPAFLDYTTEKVLGKNVADNNQSKREGIMNLSTADLQKLYIKYGPGGYDKWKAAGFPQLEEGGPIHIDPSKKGTFKAQATRMGMSVQEAASHILANKEDYTPTMVKKANFARNFAKEYGGPIFADGGEADGSMALTQINAMMDRLANLQKFITADSDLDPWISDKLSVMNHSATAINDYMQYGEEGREEEQPEMKNGGGIPERYKNMGFSRVGQKKESTRPGKKWMVLAKKGDDYKVVHGGYDGMKDFTQHHSEKRRDRFWDRMGGRDSAKAKDPFSPLYWHKRFGTWAEGGDVGSAPINTFMSPAVGEDPRFEQYYNQQMQAFAKAGVKETPNRNDVFSYYQSAAPQSAVDQTGRYVFNNAPGSISASSTFTQAVDPTTGKVIKQGTNLQKTAFDRQAQRFDFGGYLPMAAYGIDPPAKVTPDLPTGAPLYYADVYNPGQQSFSGAFPVSGQPFIAAAVAQPTIKADVNQGSGLVTPPITGMGPEIDLPMYSNYNWTGVKDPGAKVPTPPKAKEYKLDEPIARYPNAKGAPQYRYDYNEGTNGLWNNKTYDALSMMAMLPLGNRGLAGVMKAGIGAAGFVGGLGTGVDNIYRGFRPRVNYRSSSYYATPEFMQENPMIEMQRKENTPFTPPRITPGIPTPSIPGDEMRNMAAYGGQMPKYTIAGEVEMQRRFGLDPDGVSRMLGAASGLGMINDVVGYNQAFNQLGRQQTMAGMTDMRGVSNPYMPQGYDVLNVGPGQTQAPNLYTPVQFAGNRIGGYYEEGGEYEMTPEELRQFLANGGQVEFM